MDNFIELHERNSGKPILIRVKAIDCVRESDTMYSYPVTLLTIGEKECEVVESYEQVFRMIMGYSYEVTDYGGYSAE